MGRGSVVSPEPAGSATRRKPAERLFCQGGMAASQATAPARSEHSSDKSMSSSAWSWLNRRALLRAQQTQQRRNSWHRSEREERPDLEAATASGLGHRAL